MPKLGWRWLLGFSSLPLIILLAFYPLVPESPWYFTAKGETSKALEILQKMAMVNKKELPAGRLISQTSVLKKDKVVEAAGVEMVQLLPLGPPIVTADVESRFSIVEQITSSLLVLVSPPLVSSTLLLWFVFFTNAFTYYGLVLLTSQLSSGYTDCAAEIGPKSLLRKDYNNLYRDVFITSLAELPGLATAAAIVDRYGRKYSMAGLLGLCSVFLLPLVQHQTENVTTFLLFGARACIMGSFTILYIYTPELYPTRARSTGLGVANSFSRIGGLLCPLIAVGLVESCQQALAVLLFTVVPALACFAVLCFPLETKGRALSDSIDK
ncbi:hypothetical protein O6H91_20G074100 [Diphasiastrum complanatum]|uniref:Uncharacterized protein n=1 Tax=Diphasiastrum complanatum TaxID=34168 RepID=A0ACC2ARN3_DIPCM|nr:hypothetical protein O6H91_20G074100 [Diphasiastrum complanatum]